MTQAEREEITRIWIELALAYERSGDNANALACAEAAQAYEEGRYARVARPEEIGSGQPNCH